MKYNKSRAMAQVAATSLKSNIVENGTELTLVEIVEGSFEQNGKEVPNDVMLCETKDGNVRVPVREFMKMKSEGSLYGSEEGSKDIELPGKFTIVDAEPRNDRDGNPIFPVFAYNKAQEFLDGEVADWSELVAGGTKANHGFDQVQNYTISVG